LDLNGIINLILILNWTDETQIKLDAYAVWM